MFKKYDQIIAVDNISFEIFQGEIFGFLGPNGAGKTTTIRIMSGLLKPDGGHVIIASNHNGKSIGICPQHIVIWENLTCYEQIVYMGRMYNMTKKESREKAGKLLESLGLTAVKDRLAKKLSGGMQRRLNIALALIHSPEIVFLDEPQAGLDPQSRVLVREFIRGLPPRTTVILTTHDMEEAEKLSDRVCIIDRGRLLVLDTVARLKSRLGEGDLVEVEIAENIRTALLPHVPALRRSGLSLNLRDHTLILVPDEAAVVLPEILQAIKDRGLRLVNLRIRQKTLEDVFIHLTGRGLRE